MIVAVSRGGSPSPAYLGPIVEKYHLLAAKYSDAEGIHPEYLNHHYGGDNHFILLHFPPAGQDVMMAANKDGTLYNATMNYLMYLLGPTFLNGLVCDVYPFKAPADEKGKKWFQDSFGSEFVKECEAVTLELILAVSRHSAITKFVSMGSNPHRLMKIASVQFPASHIVSTTCCHPHSAMKWGIDLDMARNLDQMASLLTDLPIRSQENHYNKHRDEFDAITSCRFGGVNQTQKQRNARDPNHPDNILFGGPNETKLQRETRLSYSNPLNSLNTLFNGPNETQKQRNARDPNHPDNILFGGPNETALQRETILKKAKMNSYGGPNETEKQRKGRIESGYGGPSMTQKQKDKRLGGAQMTRLQKDKSLGGPLESQKQRDGRALGLKKAWATINAKNNLGKEVALFRCDGCGVTRERPLESRPRHTIEGKKDGKSFKWTCGKYVLV